MSDRLTVRAWRNLDPWECCGQDKYCQRGCHEAGGCANGCIVPKLYTRLAKYEDAVEQMPKADASGVEWHKVTTRPLTDEEIAYYAELEIDGIEYIFDCEMPDDGQEILIATKWGTDKDICSCDAEYGIGLEGRGDWDGVFAWAAMPQYREDDDNEATHEAGL